VQYFHLRPKHTPRERPHEWWIYSGITLMRTLYFILLNFVNPSLMNICLFLLTQGTVILFELRRKRSTFSWTAFNERRHQKQTYISLYKKMRLGVLTLTEQHSLTQLEMILPYSDIVLYA
jgi:hypothetical protein